MSLLYGIINKKGATVDPTKADAIYQSIGQRANGNGYTWTEKNASFGFRRSGFDSNNDATFLLDKNEWIILADVKLFNRNELCDQLHLDQLRFKTEPDSVLVLEAFLKWGKNCVAKLEGEFAFAIWNKNTQQLFIACDAIGFQPMFYYDTADQFIFCSEIKSILSVKSTQNSFNEETLIDYHFRAGSSAITYDKDVSALCGGNFLQLDKERIGITRYRNLSPSEKYRFTKEDDWYQCFVDLFTRAIENRMPSESTYGITLSGGLDSSAIACILADILRKKNQPLHAFSSVLPLGHTGIEKDERDYIRIINQHHPNIIQSFVEAPGISLFNRIEEAFDIEEQFPNPFFYMDRAILEVAADKNVQTLFSGYGGDYWASYNGHGVIYDLFANGKWKQSLSLAKQLRAADKKSISDILRQQYLTHTPVAAWVRGIRRKINDDWQSESMLLSSFYKLHGEIRSRAPFDLAKQYAETGRIGRTMGMLSNRNACFNMRSACPFLDVSVIEFMSCVPSNLFLKDGQKRAFFRNAMNGIVPQKVLERKDKLPYAPGYHQRILDDKKFVGALLNAPENQFLFDSYFSKKKMTDNFDTIAPQAGFTPAKQVNALRFTQAFIAAISMKYLMEIKSYKL